MVVAVLIDKFVFIVSCIRTPLGGLIRGPHVRQRAHHKCGVTSRRVLQACSFCDLKVNMPRMHATGN